MGGIVSLQIRFNNKENQKSPRDTSFLMQMKPTEHRKDMHSYLSMYYWGTTSNIGGIRGIDNNIDEIFGGHVPRKNILGGHELILEGHCPVFEGQI